MYIYGKNVAREKLSTDDKILRAYLSTKFNDQDIIKALKTKHVKINLLPPYELDKKVEGLHQGIILEVDDIKTHTYQDIIPHINKKYPLVVMLDHFEDPHNFGAIIRTSVALGVDAIIIPNDRSVPINGTVVKTSAGTIDQIPIIRVANLGNTIKKLKDDNYWIVGTNMDGTDYTIIDYHMPICLIIGNEGKGMSPIITKNCDYLVTIPMESNVNSLNASVSCGIILSQIIFQRRK